MKSHRVKILIVCGILVGVMLCVFLMPARFMGNPLRAQVVDVVTLQPIVGAQIEVNWHAWHPTLNMCNAAHRPVHTDRAVTDATGFFEIAGWGPVYLPRRYSLDSADPHLVIRQTGYEDRLIGSYLTYGDADGFAPLFAAKRLDAGWNAKRIALYPKGRKDILSSQGFDPY